jgi:hypothetical protein
MPEPRIPIWQRPLAAKKKSRHANIAKWLPVAAMLSLGIWFFALRLLHIAHPLVGAYIGVLAFVAGLVTLWPPDNPWAKAMWLTVFGGLLVLEISTLYQQRAEDATTDRTKRKEEDDRFAGILKANQDAFVATMKEMGGLAKLSKTTIDEITGGDSYPSAVAIVNPHDGLSGFPIIIDNSGPNTLYGLSVTLGNVKYDLGDVLPYDLKFIPFRARLPVDETHDLHYFIMFRARNGAWTESLTIRRHGTEIRNAVTVYTNQYPGRPSHLVKSIPFDKN